MKQSDVGNQRKNRLAQAFERLTSQNQTYIDTLTARLAKIHKTAPASQVSTGKKPKNRVKPK